MTMTAAASQELHEPYETYKANALRSECYRRGVPPVKSGPGMNNHKAGFVALLRAYDRRISTTCHVDDEATALDLANASATTAADSTANEEPLAKRRKRTSARIQAAALSNSTTTTTSTTSAAIAVDTTPPSLLSSKLQPTMPAQEEDEATTTAASASNTHEQQQYAHSKSTQMTPVERAKAALFETQRSMLERQQLAAEHRDLIVSVAQVQTAIARVKATERNSVAAAAVLADLELDLEFMLRQKRHIRARLDAYFDCASARKRVSCV